MIHKKRKKNASFGFSSHIQGRFRPFLACFGCFSAVSAAGRYDSIWSIRPDFGRISSVWRESKPIRHESSCIGANRAKSARIREKKKKKNADAVRRAGNHVGRRVPHRTPRPASDAGAAPLVPCLCFLDSLVCSLSKTFFLNLLLFLSLSCFPASTPSGCCVNWFKKTKER